MAYYLRNTIIIPRQLSTIFVLSLQDRLNISEDAARETEVNMPEYMEGTFRCSICAKEFLTRDETKKHIRETHAEVTEVLE
jgi:hypothetical protein